MLTTVAYRPRSCTLASALVLAQQVPAALQVPMASINARAVEHKVEEEIKGLAFETSIQCSMLIGLRYFRQHYGYHASMTRDSKHWRRIRSANGVLRLERNLTEHTSDKVCRCLPLDGSALAIFNVFHEVQPYISVMVGSPSTISLHIIDILHALNIHSPSELPHDALLHQLLIRPRTPAQRRRLSQLIARSKLPRRPSNPPQIDIAIAVHRIKLLTQHRQARTISSPTTCLRQNRLPVVRA